MRAETHLDPDLGSLLLEKKLITESQLREAVARFRLKGGYLSQHLIQLGYIKDKDLSTFLTCHYGFCYLPMQAYNIAETSLGLIPKEMAHDYHIVPVERNDKLLTVVMADPLNAGVVELLRQTTQCEIVIFISSYQEVAEVVQKYYGGPGAEMDLDRLRNDPALRDNLTRNLFISTGAYTGPNRRRYRRWKVDLPAEYYLYPHTIKTTVKNISLSGVSFSSAVPLTRNSQIAITIQLDNLCTIKSIVEIARCLPKNMDWPVYQNKMQRLYEVGAFFNFISQPHQDNLAEFLKKLPEL